MNFQAFALCDMKMAAREGCRGVGQKMNYLEEAIISMCQISTAMIFRFNSKTQWLMFMLLHGRHVCVPPKGRNMAFPYEAL